MPGFFDVDPQRGKEVGGARWQRQAEERAVMTDVVREKELYEILAQSSLADDRTLVLKQGDTFAVFDRHGDIPSLGPGHHGIYHAGTRFLSRCVLQLEQHLPLLLSSTVRDNNALLTVDLTNPNLDLKNEQTLPRGALHISRSKFLWHQVCYERLRISNFGPDSIDLSLTLQVESDFADIFEVRGTKRKQRGRQLDPEVSKDRLVFSYEGLDGVTRSTRLTCSVPLQVLSNSALGLRVQLKPQEEQTFDLYIACEGSDSRARPLAFSGASSQVAKEIEAMAAGDCAIYTSNEQFNDWLNRSIADLRMMVSPTPTGPYPYAGVPWFNAPFGRDGIITALEALRSR